MSAGIEGTAYLYTSERTVGKVSAVFACKWNTLCDTLVDDGSTDLCETVDVRFAASVVTALDGVVEETIDCIIVILVVLGSIDTTLSGN